MRIENFQNIQIIKQTAGAEIYEASKGESPYRMFILKRYNDECSDRNIIKEEMEISQEIASYAPDGIVVPITEIVSHEGKQYAVMEKKRTGVFLQSMIRDDGLPVKDVFRLAESILKALCTLHSFAGSEPRIGYLHLDLHPGNIFIEHDEHDSLSEVNVGSARFIDFATALKIYDGKPCLRENWAVSSYSAPELYRTEKTWCSPATDTYSVGAILYTLLTGKPFSYFLTGSETGSTKVSFPLIPQYDTCSQAAKHAEEHCLQRGVPKSICRMIESFFRCCLNYNPRYRFSTAGKMLDSVRRIQKILTAYDGHKYEDICNMLYEYGLPAELTGAEDMEYDSREFEKAVRSLENMLLQNIIDYRRTKYLFDMYWKIAADNKDGIPGDILYSLINSGIAACNHIGDVNLGDELYEAMSGIADKIELGKYLNYLNRAAVRKADRFCFSEAAEIQRRNIEAQKRIKAGLFEAGQCVGKTSEINTQIIPLARAFSSLPGYLVLNDREYPAQEIWNLYKNALAEFGTDCSNRGITICHMMQYAITSHDRNRYEQLASEYFQMDIESVINPFDQKLRELLSQDISDWYGLFVLIKGVYTFYMESLSEETAELLRELGRERLPAEKASDPIELIYKYIGLIEFHIVGEVTEFVTFMFDRSLECVPEGIIDNEKMLNIYMLISYQTKSVYFELTEDEAANKELYALLREQAVRDGWSELVKKLNSGVILSELMCWEYA